MAKDIFSGLVDVENEFEEFVSNTDSNKIDDEEWFWVIYNCVLLYMSQ